MPWMRVDDKLHSHAKVARAGTEAIGLWVLAGSWCMQHLTDGFVPRNVAVRLAPGADDLAAALVRAGLWHEAERDGEDGWLFHQWTEHQPAAATIRADREKARERMQRVRASRSSSGDVRANTARTHPEPVPTGRTRGTRIPDDFAVTPEMRSWANAHGLGWLDLDAITDAFRDYWIAQPGQRGVKIDWIATWRNWIRREAQRSGRTAATPPQRSPWDVVAQ